MWKMFALCALLIVCLAFSDMTMSEVYAKVSLIQMANEQAHASQEAKITMMQRQIEEMPLVYNATATMQSRQTVAELEAFEAHVNSRIDEFGSPVRNVLFIITGALVALSFHLFLIVQFNLLEREPRATEPKVN